MTRRSPWLALLAVPLLLAFSAAGWWQYQRGVEKARWLESYTAALAAPTAQPLPAVLVEVGMSAPDTPRRATGAVELLPAPLLSTLHSPIVGTPGEIRGRRGSWRHQRLNAAGYGLGWRIYDYSGHRMVFHGGAVQGYRGAIAMLPERDLGVVILWNSGSSLPSGLMPTILDRAIGLSGESWLAIDYDYDADDIRYGDEGSGDSNNPAHHQAGTSASTSHAMPH